MKFYDGRFIEAAQVTIKLDGINVRLRDGKAVSRNDKVLKGVDPSHLEEGVVYEAFWKDWATSSSLVKTKGFPKEGLIAIDPPDRRLIIGRFDIDIMKAHEVLTDVLKAGYEGIVIDGEWKMKPSYTYDVPVLKVLKGTGKNIDRVGALVTPMGKVGIGFKDEDRIDLLGSVGWLIEVECAGLTPNGKFKHPRFKRVRWDKDEADAAKA